MKYFIVTVDEHYKAPMPVGWYGKLDRKVWKGKKAYDMPGNLFFYLGRHMQMVFTDIITYPCFMVSRMVKDVWVRYDPFIQFSRVVLYDKEQKGSMAYYMPFLENAEVKWKDDSLPAIYIDEITADKVVLEMDVRGEHYPVFRMDFLESILRRGAVGLGIKEVQMLPQGEQ